ncbi:MAG TPA: deoxyguanosinetriphosphate triphosphohydrolase, partial [Rubrivivax sp.]|nr:deoxyguanosinetriphosphate triphosphohydrolase [Rubrivivax sp.]
RSVARRLRLDEDLVEAISLAHDLGHAPFGHAGQEALQACMRAHGGFEHNLQSLRIVDHLERRYLSFDGLNLAFETREGILKHCSGANARELTIREPGGVAARFLGGGQPSLEAQVVNLADAMAYNAHDIDDGLRAGLLQSTTMTELPLLGRLHGQVLAEHPALEAGSRRTMTEVLRRLLASMVDDLVQATSDALQEMAPRSADEVRASPAIARHGERMQAELRELSGFLFTHLYRHPQVVDSTARGRQAITELFQAYADDPSALPADFPPDAQPLRRATDYIAGMTDRFALREHRRLTGRALFAIDP